MSLKIKLFTLRFNPSLGEIDDREAARFLAGKELIEVRDHFFIHQGLPHLLLILLYNSIAGGEGDPDITSNSKSKERFDPKELLSDKDWPLYTSLKEWRNELAKSEGIPPYIIATNRQIAEIAKNRPDTLDGLKLIEGLGKAKIETYGNAILGFVSAADKPIRKDQTKPKEANDTPQ